MIAKRVWNKARAIMAASKVSLAAREMILRNGISSARHTIFTTSPTTHVSVAIVILGYVMPMQTTATIFAKMAAKQSYSTTKSIAVSATIIAMRLARIGPMLRLANVLVAPAVLPIMDATFLMRTVIRIPWMVAKLICKLMLITVVTAVQIALRSSSTSGTMLLSSNV